jgi:hypothetical protein
MPPFHKGKMTMHIALRVVASAIALLAWSYVNFVLNRAAPLAAGTLAAAQFDNSVAGYAQGEVARWFNGAGLPSVLLLAVLAVIWWRTARKWLGKTVIVVAVLAPTAAGAYYDKTDYTEPYFILPNESAFFVPDIGANKDNQAQFGSEAYLEANKIAAKRFIVPHSKLSGSGLLSDYYVPAGRLIVVDRTPYNREWTSAANRGTSAKDESLPC